MLYHVKLMILFSGKFFAIGINRDTRVVMGSHVVQTL